MLVLQLIGGLLMFAAGVVLLARLASGPKTPGQSPSAPSASEATGGVTGVVPAVVSAVVRRGLRIAQWPGALPARRRVRRRSFDEEFARLAEQLRKND